MAGVGGETGKQRALPRSPPPRPHHGRGNSGRAGLWGRSCAARPDRGNPRGPAKFFSGGKAEPHNGPTGGSQDTQPEGRRAGNREHGRGGKGGVSEGWVGKRANTGPCHAARPKAAPRARQQGTGWPLGRSCAARPDHGNPRGRVTFLSDCYSQATRQPTILYQRTDACLLPSAGGEDSPQAGEGNHQRGHGFNANWTTGVLCHSLGCGRRRHPQPREWLTFGSGLQRTPSEAGSLLFLCSCEASTFFK